jgi:hypothetical protein
MSTRAPLKNGNRTRSTNTNDIYTSTIALHHQQHYQRMTHPNSKPQAQTHQHSQITSTDNIENTQGSIVDPPEHDLFNDTSASTGPQPSLAKQK